MLKILASVHRSIHHADLTQPDLTLTWNLEPGPGKSSGKSVGIIVVIVAVVGAHRPRIQPQGLAGR